MIVLVVRRTFNKIVKRGLIVSGIRAVGVEMKELNVNILTPQNIHVFRDTFVSSTSRMDCVALDSVQNFRILMIVKQAYDVNGKKKVVIVPVHPIQIKKPVLKTVVSLIQLVWFYLTMRLIQIVMKKIVKKTLG
jgi:hypothetical protein